ncbi:MAG TPA: AAA family ATPase [Patescibacteria group bacterium]|nr:AAA family ATPase [Patescibacteria group bacterium]
MGFTIAVAGKGGVGKTTLAALVVRSLKEKKLGSVLAVDADPNSNLAEALGMEAGPTVGQLLDEVAAHPERIPSGMPKDRFIEYQVQSLIQEGEGFDVITMGRPEGPGCYCYVNNVLRGVMSKLIKEYDYIIIDNEAGLEHLSRRTTRAADTLLVVSDATAVALKAAGRINELAGELGIKTGQRLLVVNRNNASIPRERIQPLGLEYAGDIPVDEELFKISVTGNSLWGLDPNAPSLRALHTLGDQIWQRS